MSNISTPLFVIHGLLGSNLFVTYKNAAPFYFCDKEMNDVNLLTSSQFTKPKDRCSSYLLAPQYFPEADTIGSAPHVTIQGRENQMKNFANNLEAQGYKRDDDLFMEAYDWRLAPLAITPFYEQLKAKIENVSQAKGQKVGLLGYSLGSHVINYFINHYIKDEEWVTDHISKIALMAPAFAGNQAAFASFLSPADFLGQFHVNNTDLVKNFVKMLVSAHILLPNSNYAEEMFILPGGIKANATMMETIIKQLNLLDDDQMRVFHMTQKIQTQPFEHWMVPTFLYYNSGIDSTINGFNLTEGFSMINGPGDGTVPSKPLQKLIEQWKKDQPDLTESKDAQSSDQSLFSHGAFQDNAQVALEFFNYFNKQ